jgi:aspartate aminotransferase-like enzyme
VRIPNVMTPGPTQVRDNVRLARALETTNPDLDEQFFEFYKNTCNKIGKFLKTDNEIRILCGEGILGLEAACASLTEKGDRVLVIDNGIFGEGFADFVTMYGGEAVLFKADRRRAIDLKALKEFLSKDSNFKYATIVHCDTPSGVLNDVGSACRMLKEKGILTVVDSVAAMGGEELRVDDWKIDIVLGGSQKCISAPPGLTLLSISNDAFEAMGKRKTPIASYYCNLLIWKDYYDNLWFPYTMPISDIYGLGAAIDNMFEDGLDNIINRHKRIGSAVREAVLRAGIKLYIEEGYANTVTAIELPKDIEDKAFRKYIRDNFNLLIGGSIGELNGKVIRIGHMGENAVADKVSYVLMAIGEAFKEFGFECKEDMVKVFLECLNR